MPENEDGSSLFLDALEALFPLLIGFVLCAAFFGGDLLSGLSIFQNKSTTKTFQTQMQVQYIANWQTSPQTVLLSETVWVEVVETTQVDWVGRNPYKTCTIEDILSPDPVVSTRDLANNILAVAGLPLEFVLRGSVIDETVDCDGLTDLSRKVYLEVYGATGEGDFFWMTRSPNDYELAKVALPRNLYDLVLVAAINRTQFVMPNYATSGWYRGQALASVTYEAGDPNGLDSWTQSWLPTLQYVYGTSLVSTSPITTEVEVAVGSKKVKVGEHTECDETSRYKGNCRDFDIVPDYKNVPVTEVRQITSVDYFMP